MASPSALFLLDNEMGLIYFLMPLQAIQDVEQAFLAYLHYASSTQKKSMVFRNLGHHMNYPIQY